MVDQILVAGGGIAGLSAAIALGRQGRAVRVLERAQEFSEAGAGIQLGSNAVRVLNRLGVAEALAPGVAAPEELELFDAQSTQSIARLPLGDTAERRYGAPYWVAHRRDLQKALLETAESLSSIEIETGFHVEHVAQSRDGVVVSNASRHHVEGSGLVGADGTWSEVRQACFTKDLPQFVRRTAFRGVLNIDEAPNFVPAHSIGLWLGRESHLEHYPVSGGHELSVVVMVDDDWHGRDWGAAADGETLARRLKGKGWNTKILRLVSATRRWSKWALHLGPQLKRWTEDRVALLGDAAHPALPYLAQGAGMAIEDAEALSHAFATSRDDVARAFAVYEQDRLKRATRVQIASKRLGWLLHLGPGLSALRNAALRQTSGPVLLSRLDWLYGQAGH